MVARAHRVANPRLAASSLIAMLPEDHAETARDGAHALHARSTSISAASSCRLIACHL